MYKLRLIIYLLNLNLINNCLSFIFTSCLCLCEAPVFLKKVPPKKTLIHLSGGQILVCIIDWFTPS